MEIIRRCRFKSGDGARTYTLTLWDTNRYDNMRKPLIGYQLSCRGVVLFTGEDIGASPCHAIDSDEAVRGVMAFLTLRPGDTDAEYFANYTEAQMEFARGDAEWLGYYVAECWRRRSRAA